jgi:hypothetical protein
LRIVFGLKVLVRDLGQGDAFDIARSKEGAPLVLEAQLHRVGHVLGRDIGQHLLLHQLLQHAVEQDLRRQFLVLRGQHRAHRDEVAHGDVVAVHGGQNGVRIDLGLLRGNRQAGERDDGGAGKKLLHGNPFMTWPPDRIAEGPR